MSLPDLHDSGMDSMQSRPNCLLCDPELPALLSALREKVVLSRAVHGLDPCNECRCDLSQEQAGVLHERLRQLYDTCKLLLLDIHSLDTSLMQQVEDTHRLRSESGVRKANDGDGDVQ